MEKKILLLLTGCFTLLFSSCLGSDDPVEYEIAKNCQISSFVMNHDSIATLATTKFTIDQLNGRIFNQDSLPYGTKVDKVVVTAKYAFELSVGMVQVIQEAVGDTINWNGKDSLDYSKPVKFIVTAYDGFTKKIYDTRLNVHQVVPDSMVWSLDNSSLPGTSVAMRKVIPFVEDKSEQYFMYTQEADGYHLYTASPSALNSWDVRTLAGLPKETVKLDQITEYENQLYVPTTDQKLYSSKDGLNWAALENTPSVISLLGAVHEETTAKKPSALAVVASVEGGNRFASMDKDGVWKEGSEISADFPVSGFSPLSYNVMYRERLMLAGGKTVGGKVVSTVWSTMDGLDWVSLISDAKFGARQGASVAHYDSTFFMVGGYDDKGVALKDIYRSRDNGLTWIVSDTLVVMPEAYKAKAFSSMLVDNKTNYIYLFGGKEKQNTNDSGELWRGRINRLGFKK